MTNFNRILFVINPVSGGTGKDSLVGKIKEFCADYSKEYTIVFTRSGNIVDDIEDAINEFNPDCIAVAGGDGTINLVASLILNLGIPMAIIPSGSANGLAAELRIPGNVTDSLALLNSRKMVSMDVVEINGQGISVHLCDFGFNARIVEQFELQGTRGWMGYARKFFSILRNHEPAQYKIITGNKIRKIKAHMVVIGNSTRYGTGAVINDRGKINDGKFEIIAIRPVKYKHFVQIFFAMFTTGLTHLPFVKTFSVDRAVIYNRNLQPFQTDGELMGKPEKVRFRNIKRSIQIVVPDYKN